MLRLSRLVPAGPCSGGRWVHTCCQRNTKELAHAQSVRGSLLFHADRSDHFWGRFTGEGCGSNLDEKWAVPGGLRGAREADWCNTVASQGRTCGGGDRGARASGSYCVQCVALGCWTPESPPPVAAMSGMLPFWKGVTGPQTSLCLHCHPLRGLWPRPSLLPPQCPGAQGGVPSESVLF